MIDHVSVAVTNLEASAEFYGRVLQALGLKRLVERENTIGFGKKYPEFWLNFRSDSIIVEDGTGCHICLRAPTREAVTDFYATALALGGRGDGKPSERQATMTTYFGSFIRDLDGNKIEAACFPRAEDT